MRKSRILGCALTLAATLVVGGAMGQIPTTNFAKVGTLTDEGDSENQFSLVQKGLSYGYYVTPDAAFHPTYSTAGTLTKDFIWTWTSTPNTATITPTASGKGDGTANKANFASILFPNTGKYSLVVSEAAPAAWGLTCTATTRTFDVYAFDVPTFASLQDTTKTDNAVNKRSPICDLTKIPTVGFSIKSSGTPYVKFSVTAHKAYVNLTTGAINVGVNEFTIAGFTAISETEKFGTTPWLYSVSKDEELTGTTAGNAAKVKVKNALVVNTPTLADYDLTFDPAKLGLKAPASGLVAYRVTVVSSNGLLSRKADYDDQGAVVAGGFKFYNSVGSVSDDKTNVATYDVVLAAIPKTGPVYHIGNNKAN